MSESAEVTARLLAELNALEGLRPWNPVRRGSGSLAIDLGADGVRIKLVASRLPLPPRLDQAEAAVRKVLRGTRWERAVLRLVVAGLDASALDPPGS